MNHDEYEETKEINVLSTHPKTKPYLVEKTYIIFRKSFTVPNMKWQNPIPTNSMDTKVETWGSPRRDPLVPGASLIRDARLKPKVIQTHPKNLTPKTPNFCRGEGGYIININSGCEGKLFPQYT